MERYEKWIDLCEQECKEWAQWARQHGVVYDAEGNAIPFPLHGVGTTVLSREREIRGLNGKD